MVQAMLHTIGYEGISIDDFLATLDSVGINLLIDVRDVPISRKPGFSKSAFAGRLASCGIEYVHLKGLGDPKPGRVAAREGRFSDFRRIFGEHLESRLAQADLQRAIDIAQGRVPCLLCFERDHSHCHRRIVAEEMSRRAGFRLVHLGVRQGLSVELNLANRSLRHGGLALVR